MKKLLLSAALCAMIAPNMAAADNMAVQFPNSSTGMSSHPRLVVDETILGVTRAGDDWVTVENSFTQACWVRINQLQTNQGNVLFGHQPQTHINYNGSYYVSVPSGTGIVTLAGKRNSGAYTFSESSDLSATTGDWHYYAVSYDATAGSLTLYIDGNGYAQADLSGQLQLFPDNPGVVFFGSYGANADFDEAQIWNRALTPEEVSKAMEDATAVSDGLVALYTFDTLKEGTVGTFENLGSAKEFPITYLIGTGTADGSGVISCGSNHTESAPTMVEGRQTVSIDDIAADVEEDPASVRYYNLQGMEVKAENAVNGLYIRKSNTKVQKILVK